MAVRILVMCSFMLLELGLGIAAIVGVTESYPYRMDGGGIAGCVLLSIAIPMSWLLTIAFFLRQTSRAKARRLIDDAEREAARILADASEKALALCSLDGGRCPQCGNPRTGKFCPKCGNAGAPRAA
jgi:hypothetical protein